MKLLVVYGRFIAFDLPGISRLVVIQFSGFVFNFIDCYLCKFEVGPLLEICLLDTARAVHFPLTLNSPLKSHCLTSVILLLCCDPRLTLRRGCLSSTSTSTGHLRQLSITSHLYVFECLGL